MSSVKSAIGLKSYDWSSVELLRDVQRSDIKTPQHIIDARRENFWHDMSSEFDSINFIKYLFSKNDIAFTDEFVEFVCLWHLDEQNHYRGLRKINSILYGMSEPDIDREISRSEPNFDSISEFMRDEFTILLSIAFDEVTSTRAYNQDRPLFDSMGPSCLSDWIKYAARDEAAHYGNSIKLIKLRHSHRLGEAKEILDNIFTFETGEHFTYNRTFIFDHDTDDFSRELLEDSRKTIYDVLGLT